MNTTINIDLAKKIISELREHKIHLKLNDENNIEIISYEKNLLPEIVEKIKQNKTSLIDYLKNINTKSLEIPLLEEAEKYPLSSGQHRLWVVDKFEGKTAAFNMPFSVALDEKIEVEILEKSVYAVIERHEILRTIFEEDGKGEIWQKIIPFDAFDFKIDYKDFRSEVDALKSKNDYIYEDSGTPFNLAKGPLLRVALIQTSDTSYTFYYNLHHVICDGWSLNVLLKDVMSYYDAFKNDDIPNIPNLKIQYKDYASWQLSQLKSENIKVLKEYWNSALSGEIPLLNLPSQKNRPNKKTYNGDSLQTYISSEITQKLKEIVNHQGASLFMGVLASMNIILYKYTSVKDIVIGSPLPGRDQLELEDQIGFYLNIIPFRNQINPDNNFVRTLSEIKETTLSAFKHQSYPFDLLVEDLNVKYDMSRSPIFDISLTFNNISDSNKIISNDKINNIVLLGKSKCKNDIEFHFEEVNNILSFVVNYNSDIYEQEMMINFMHHYKNVLEELVNSPEISLEKIDYLSKEEKNQLLIEFNDNKIEFDDKVNVLELFRKQVENKPEQFAIVFENKKMTYKDLDESSDKVANFLKEEFNIQSNDIVGIELDRNDWTIIAILGVIKAGAAYVPVNPLLPEEHKKHILTDTNASLLITESNYVFSMDYYDGNIFAIDLEFDGLSDNTVTETAEIKGSDLAYVIYTSGTTGIPKGVMVEHGSLASSIVSRNNFYENLNSILSITPFSFDASIGLLWNALTTGTEYHIINEERIKNPDYIIQYIKDNNIEFLANSPSFYNMILKNPAFYNTNLKRIVLGGESINQDIIKKHFETHPDCKVFNEYGPTENTIWATVLEVDENFEKNLIGKPIANNQIYILDDALKLLPINVKGEIYIGGNNVARGYINQPELTTEKFISNPFKEGERLYRTGDFGRWTIDGNIEFIGRQDNQVKIRGFRVELGEIESKIQSKEDINEVVVMVKTDKFNQNELMAYISSDVELNPKEVRQYLSERLPEYMIPSKIIQIEKIPLTINGKIDKAKLLEQEGKMLAVELVDYVAPETEIEIILVNIIKNLLEIEELGVNEDFFSIGGNSLKLIELISALRQEGYNIDISEIIKNPVIREFSKLIEAVELKETNLK